MVLMQGKLIAVAYTLVKINSKYKEDDFSDSNAVAFSLDVSVLKSISTMKPTCNPRFFSPPPSTDPSPGSQLWKLKTLTTPSQPWLLHDDDSDTEPTTEDTACT